MTAERVRLLASHQGEPGSIPRRTTPGFSHVGIVPDDAAGRRVFSGISRFPPPFHSNLTIINLRAGLRLYDEDDRGKANTRVTNVSKEGGGGWERRFRGTKASRVKHNRCRAALCRARKNRGEKLQRLRSAVFTLFTQKVVLPQFKKGLVSSGREWKRSWLGEGEARVIDTGKKNPQVIAATQIPTSATRIEFVPGLTSLGKSEHRGRGGRAVSLLASHQGGRVSIPGWVTPDFRMWESCRTMPLVGGSRFPCPFIPELLHSLITLIGSQDLDVKQPPKSPTLHFTTLEHNSGYSKCCFFTLSESNFCNIPPCVTSGGSRQTHQRVVDPVGVFSAAPKTTWMAVGGERGGGAESTRARAEPLKRASSPPLARSSRSSILSLPYEPRCRGIPGERAPRGYVAHPVGIDEVPCHAEPTGNAVFTEPGRNNCTLYREQPIRKKWLDYSPSALANRIRLLAGSPPDFRTWESCRTVPLVGGFSQGSPPPAFAFRRCSILTSLHTLHSTIGRATSLGRASGELIDWFAAVPVPPLETTPSVSPLREGLESGRRDRRTWCGGNRVAVVCAGVAPRHSRT
ncbi:hypothetical protein PR048_026037 [Dryococelus australis]|uniref:Uncharacterized protein n=1 Tax=Dryococelus australis TaxID=614101 RepID=A0ABQ9GK72_9NEOP|nr:hypothetical protein PR048_026037 [Dryococelus australis]